MRCAAPVQFWAYTTATGSTRVEVQGLTLSADGAACTGSELVVMTQAELDDATASPFRLSLDEGGAISGAILGVWAAAWAIRTMVRVLRHTDTTPEAES